MPAHESDLRAHPRIAVQLPVVRYKKDQPITELGLNISKSGLALRTHSMLGPRTTYEMRVSSPDGERYVDLKAQVTRLRWSAPHQPNDVGFQFVDMNGRTEFELEELLFHLLQMPDGNRACPRFDLRAEAMWKPAGSAPAHAVELLNVSLTGAQLRCEVPPQPGALGLLTLKVHGGLLHSMPSRVTWVADARAGVRFEPEAKALASELVQQLLVGGNA